MYFDFTTYFRMLRRVLRERNRANRRRLLLALLVVVPVVSSFHAVCFLLDRILFPGLRHLEVRTPVFIVGHARSGTTLLHRLMASDGQRFSYFLLWELFFPSLIQKKAIRFLGRVDRRILGGWLEQKLREWDDRKFGSTRDMHDMSLLAPEEDDFVQTFSCASGFWIVQAPYLQHLDFYYVDEWPPRRRRRLLRFYRACVERQLYLNGTDKIHLSKNPTFCGRVESLIETFPDARIVVTARNPHETIPSLLKLLKTAWELRGWRPDECRESLEQMAAQSIHSYRHPLEVLARHPETKHAIVDYRDLVREPGRTVKAVYRQLGFDVSPELEAVLRRREEKARTHETQHRYSLEMFGLKASEIHAALGSLFDRFGWEDPEEAAEARRDGAARQGADA